MIETTIYYELMPYRRNQNLFFEDSSSSMIKDTTSFANPVKIHDSETQEQSVESTKEYINIDFINCIAKNASKLHTTS